MLKVSVVMASRNPNPTMLKEAIDSVLGQTFKDFELIIVDDGSNSSIEPIVRSISEDTRIKVYGIKHSGLGAALNHGISEAEGEYIARLDDDDMMLPTRLEKQLAFLDEHTDVSCAGTWFYDKVGNKYYPHRKYPVENDEIAKGLLARHFLLAHTSVMFRKSAWQKIGGYRVAGGGQDLDLFLQLGTVGNLANIDEYLTCYRISATGLATVNPKKHEAYLFALEDVVKRRLYPQYIDIAKASIEGLKEEQKKMPKMKYYRMLMVWRVKLLGKKLQDVL